MSFKTTYQTRGNFFAWCTYWTNQGFLVHHTSWKPYYPKFKTIEKNTEELIEKHSYNKYIHKDKEYYAIDEKGTHLFFDMKIPRKGEWQVENSVKIDELFE
jgi:hypothetical protein